MLQHIVTKARKQPLLIKKTKRIVSILETEDIVYIPDKTLL